jgi:N-acetylmuramoyl-L-alanine amidase
MDRKRGQVQYRYIMERQKKLTIYSGILAVLVLVLMISVIATMRSQKVQADEKKTVTVQKPQDTVEQETETENTETEVEQVGEGLTIVLDPGHGALDPGCGGYDDIWEADINLAVARKLEEQLVKYGYTVLYTRQEEETYLDVYSRADYANEQDADLFVSIHMNADGTEDGEGIASGIETWYSNKGDDSETFAKLVQESVIAATGAEDIGYKDDIYVVTHDTTMPAILIECGFLTYRQERENLASDSYQTTLAEGIVSGIVQFTKESVLK